MGRLWRVDTRICPSIGRPNGARSLDNLFIARGVTSWCGTMRPPDGIVKLSGIAMIDPQHTGFATGLEPIILGVGQPDSA